MPVAADWLGRCREFEFKGECVCTGGQGGGGLDEDDEALEEEALAAPFVPEVVEYILAVDARECAAVDGDGQFGDGQWLREREGCCRGDVLAWDRVVRVIDRDAHLVGGRHCAGGGARSVAS